MHCLYRSDYGPPDTAFHPDANGGVLLRRYESNLANPMCAKNLRQF
jgi:hypothetical protein